MEQFFVLVVIGITSLGAFLLGASALGLSGGGLRAAVGKTLEGVGLTLVFFLTNQMAGMAIVLLGRHLAQWFAPLSLANDVTLLGLSLLQGLTFQWWRERRTSSEGQGIGTGG